MTVFVQWIEEKCIFVNATYYTNENTKVDELYEDAYRYRKGKPTDGMCGELDVGSAAACDAG